MLNHVKHFDDKYLRDLVKSFLDLIVLAMLNGEPAHGYMIIANLHRTFGVLLSPGTLYPLLYQLEANRLINVRIINNRKVYSLTPLGLRKVNKTYEAYKKSSEIIFNFVDRNLLDRESTYLQPGSAQALQGEYRGFEARSKQALRSGLYE